MGVIVPARTDVPTVVTRLQIWSLRPTIPMFVRHHCFCASPELLWRATGMCLNSKSDPLVQQAQVTASCAGSSDQGAAMHRSWESHKRAFVAA